MNGTLKALKSARLLLYAWKHTRQCSGLPDNHDELNATIREVESAINEMQDTAEGTE